MQKTEQMKCLRNVKLLESDFFFFFWLDFDFCRVAAFYSSIDNRWTFGLNYQNEVSLEKERRWWWGGV